MSQMQRMMIVRWDCEKNEKKKKCDEEEGMNEEKEREKREFKRREGNDRKASIHRSTQEGNIPLFSAIEVGNLSVSRELLLTHTQVTSWNVLNRKKNIFFDWNLNADMFTIQEQLKAGKGTSDDQVNLEFHFPFLCFTFVFIVQALHFHFPFVQALHLAARKGDNDLVKLFIESGTRVDTQNVSKIWSLLPWSLIIIISAYAI